MFHLLSLIHKRLSLSNYPDPPVVGVNVSGSGTITINGIIVSSAGAAGVERRSSKSGTIYATLTPGDYNLTAYTEADLANGSVQYVQETDVFTPGVKPAKRRPAGGVRIAKIIDSDGVNPANNVVKIYQYTREEEPCRSSGSLVKAPKYNFLYKSSNRIDGSSTEYLAKYTGRSSTSKVALGSTQGSHIGYSQVTVLYGEGGENGKTVYEYTSPLEFRDLGGEVFPFPLANSTDWQRGHLKGSRDFDSNGRMHKEVKYTYKSARAQPGQTSIMGTRIGYSINSQQDIYDVLDERTYFIYVNWHVLSTATVSIFDYIDPAKSLITTTKYHYTNLAHLQPSHIVQSRSDQQESVQVITYPLDFTVPNPNNTAAIALKGLQHKNIINVPVTKQTWLKSSATDSSLLASSVTEYKQLSSGVVVPEKEFVLETAQPLPVANFTPASITGTGAFSLGSTNQLKTTLIFKELFSQLVQANVNKQAPVSYLWGYNQSYPVAEIKNASYDQVKAALGVLQTQEIDLGAGGLTAAQETALRSMPNVLVTTFTYDPLVGMISQTDPNGVPLYYEYDGLGRLIAVKNQEADGTKNLVQQYLYHYKQ